jgi:hypothetical protein
LELKLIDSDSQSTVLVSGSDPNTDEPPDTDSNDATGGGAGGSGTAAMAAQIDVLSGRFQLALGEPEHALLATTMGAVEDPRAMALGGLYLAKLGMPLTRAALGALYDAQNESPRQPRSIDSALNLNALAAASSAPPQYLLHPLIDRMDSALNGLGSAAAPPVAAAGVADFRQAGRSTNDEGQGADRESRSLDDLALKLLNVPIGATVSRQYGTFPILVAGQLLELQFVAFQHRNTPAEQNPVRRLVMTLTTATLGRIQVAAQAQGSRLSVTFTGQSANATEMLASHAPEVREIVNRLGWQVDSVVYGVGRSSSAAELAMHHALRENIMDQLL